MAKEAETRQPKPNVAASLGPGDASAGEKAAVRLTPADKENLARATAAMKPKAAPAAAAPSKATTPPAGDGDGYGGASESLPAHERQGERPPDGGVQFAGPTKATKISPSPPADGDGGERSQGPGGDKAPFKPRGIKGGGKAAPKSGGKKGKKPGNAPARVAGKAQALLGDKAAPGGSAAATSGAAGCAVCFLVWLVRARAQLAIMGPLYGSSLVLRSAFGLFACYGCGYCWLYEGPWASLLPSASLLVVASVWTAAAPAVARVGGVDRATMLQHAFPVLTTALVFVLWYETEATPHELLPASFYESNDFRLFGRNFTVHKTIDESPEVEEAAAFAAAEQMLFAAAVGMGFGAAVAAGLAPALKSLGYLSSDWPPDPIPAYEYEPNEALQPAGSPRRPVTAIRAPLLIVVMRTASSFCESLSEELLFRSVAYRVLAALIMGMREDQAHASFEVLPVLATSLLFCTKFLGYKGELLLGLLLGVLLQAELSYWGSIMPGVVTHAFVLLARDFFRATRPLPKPSRLSQGEGLLGAPDGVQRELHLG